LTDGQASDAADRRAACRADPLCGEQSRDRLHPGHFVITATIRKE
jgi:hypothetical protein